METIYVADVLGQIAQQHMEVGTGLLGEVEGEYLFYAMKAHTGRADGFAPVYRLVFEWPSAFYSTEFFTTLFGFMADDEAVDYFGHLLRHSDLSEDDELCRMVGLAFERINSDELVA